MKKLEQFIFNQKNTNFNKRPRIFDNGLQKIASTLNATEQLLLNYFISVSKSVYVDRSQLAIHLGRSVNAITDGINSLVNLGVLNYEFEYNPKCKRNFLRKKKYIINPKINEWQRKDRTDYRLKESRFIGSLRGMQQEEFNANLVLSNDYYARLKIEATFCDRTEKVRKLEKNNFPFKDVILRYGLNFLFQWLDELPTTFNEQKEDSLIEFERWVGKRNGDEIMAQRIVYFTRHKTIANDINEMEWLQVKDMLLNKQQSKERDENIMKYRSILYRFGQRVHNMNKDVFHKEKHTIAVRYLLLQQELVPVEDLSLGENIEADISLPAVPAEWQFIGGQKYPHYSNDYQPVQTYNGRIYKARSYLYAEKTANDLIQSGQVRRLHWREKTDYRKSEVFNNSYVDQRQFNYLINLKDTAKARSQEELFALGLSNIITLWDCGAITDIDVEIGYQILSDEAQQLPRHCQTAKFEPFAYIEEKRLNYKQKAKLRSILEYVQPNNATIITKLDNLLGTLTPHNGAFKEDTYQLYLNRKFKPDTLKILKTEWNAGKRVSYFDPFVRISLIRENLLKEERQQAEVEKMTTDDEVIALANALFADSTESKSILHEYYQKNAAAT